MRLSVHAWGDAAAPSVVCLHGLTGHGRRFRKLAEERLADRFHVLAVDLRGHGSSGWEPPWDIETHLADVLETADAHGIERAAWIGHSFGGRLAAEIAARAPERVRRTVLLDPAIVIEAGLALEEAESYRGDLSFASPEEAVEAKLASGAYVSTPPEVWDEEVEQHLERGGDGRYRWRYSPLAAIVAYSEMAVPGAQVPLRDALVVLGAQSWLPVPLPAEGGFEVVTVPGGHSPLFDDFDVTADAVRRFLD